MASIQEHSFSFPDKRVQSCCESERKSNASRVKNSNL
ncbi:hypothetical protein NC651_024743 [Populus alba x Populus x berolinensis]|nr:hypothetical protein NC651_024743 [Populus alba x Populus x berolinensis]